MAAEIGKITSLWRYPVKSMRGEALQAAELTEYGLLGDRAYALIDGADGKIATAKNPGKWPTLFGFRAMFLDHQKSGTTPAVVRIILPDGSTITSSAHECSQVLSKILNRPVTLAAAEQGRVTGVHAALPASWTGKAEEYWPDMEGLDHRDTVTDFALPGGTFFDGATVHLLTTATLTRLHDSYPQGRFEVPRFRPNIVVETLAGEKGFVEQTWIGHTLAIGDHVRLKITVPCGRCVMTTLSQGDLPKDSGILRTAVQQNQGYVGVYAAVVQGGTIQRGDRVRMVSQGED
ncbi:MAG TPA: MOSC domain-containing protein [Nitrospira sp.]